MNFRAPLEICGLILADIEACPCSKAHRAKEAHCRIGVQLMILDYSGRLYSRLRSERHARLWNIMAVLTENIVRAGMTGEMG